MSPWKRFRYRLEEVACLVLLWAVPKFSRRACMRAANILGALAWRLDRRGRSVALANLECVFGDRYDLAQRVKIARASYRNFARTMLDLFWLYRDWPKETGYLSQFENFGNVREQMDREKRGSVFLCVHQGNWEWASIASGLLGFGNMVVTENFKNPRLTDVFRRLRQTSGQVIIPQENSLIRMLKVVKRGAAAGMLIDLNLAPSQAATVIEGFGLKMCVPLIHAVMAQRAHAMLIPVETQPTPDGACRVIAHPEVEWPEGASLQEISQKCWEFFEPIIRERPELWLWPYKHFRYKPRGTARAYPFYANESSKFEKLLRSQGLADSFDKKG
jgi:Kdo2-lipid IVA lauroyltransferase/acyltransferase